MNVAKTFIAAAVATLGFAGASHAVSITSVDADCAAGNAAPAGVSCGMGDRRNTGNVELASMGDGDFFSLGLGGSATFSFDQLITGPGSFFEVTTNPATYYEETASVFGILNGDETFLGSISNKSNDGMSRLAFSGTFDSIRFLDTTVVPAGQTGDGYDLDAFNVAAVPLPASVLLMGGALGGLGVMRRRRKAA